MSNEPTDDGQPGISYHICWRLSDPHVRYTMAKGACVTGRCIDCNEPVVASLEGLQDVIRNRFVPIPLCQDCALRPDWREKLAGVNIVHGPNLDKRSVDAFVASLRATPDGHGIN